MTGITNRRGLACLCVAAVLPAMTATAAPPQGVTLKGNPVRIAEPPMTSLRGLRRLDTGAGQSLVAVDRSGQMTVLGTDSRALIAGAGHVADAALLTLEDGGRPQSHAMWVEPLGFGFVPLDRENARASVVQTSEAGEINGMGATRLVVARDGADNTMILVGTIGGELSAFSVHPQGDSLGVERAMRWSVDGPVKAMGARGSRAYILATTGLWSVDLSAADPKPTLEAAGRSGCLDASREIGGVVMIEDGPRTVVAVAQPGLQRIAVFQSGPGPDSCLGLVHVVHASDPEGLDTVVPSGLVGGAGTSLLVSDAQRPEVVGVPHLLDAFPAQSEALTTLAGGR